MTEKSSPPLRVVGKDEKPAKRKTVREAAAEDDPRVFLVSLRDRLAEAVQESSTPGRDLASLTRRLLEVLRELGEYDEAPDAWLVMMRDRLSTAVGSSRTSPRDLAALTRRLQEVVRELVAVDAATGEGDELAEAAATPDEEFDGELSAEAL